MTEDEQRQWNAWAAKYQVLVEENIRLQDALREKGIVAHDREIKLLREIERVQAKLLLASEAFDNVNAEVKKLRVVAEAAKNVDIDSDLDSWGELGQALTAWRDKNK